MGFIHFLERGGLCSAVFQGGRCVLEPRWGAKHHPTQGAFKCVGFTSFAYLIKRKIGRTGSSFPAVLLGRANNGSRDYADANL